MAKYEPYERRFPESIILIEYKYGNIKKDGDKWIAERDAEGVKSARYFKKKDSAINYVSRPITNREKAIIKRRKKEKK